ncbi:hypothetical protein GCM10009718_34960 [Isoptericola halotolerans]|uniref:Uncharacterized protein n=1 Tax=Isoptericola halotolerans TaxID=300560 RepID=A0ABX2A6A3_9MICO|nr:hypothetical protein [Isoptericola halotolerans]NOV97141.1 hypothetical protein [Isoptericola halotolerans]
MTSGTTAGLGPGPHARAVAAARRRFLRVLLLAGAWFWTGWALIVLSLPLIVARWGGVADGLTYDAAGSPARWPAFAIGIIATGALLRTHLAAGGTRRALVEGIARAAVLGGLAFGVATVLLTLAERGTFAALDRPWQGATGAFGLDGPAGVAGTVAAESLVITTYALVGAAVLAGYQRWGGLRGTLAIVPLLVPGVLADLATRTGIFSIPLRDAAVGPVLGTAVALGGGALAAVLAALVAHHMLRSVVPRPA